MGIVLKLLQQLYRRVFQGNKASAKARPDMVKPAKQVQKQPTKQSQTQTQKQPQKQTEAKPEDHFWRDKIKSDAKDDKQAFYEKYRHRLENQNQQHDISPKH